MKTLTLLPAYGRDYKTKKEVLSDLIANKDFIISAWIGDPEDGKYISLEQFTPNGKVLVRYCRATKVTQFDVNALNNAKRNALPDKAKTAYTRESGEKYLVDTVAERPELTYKRAIKVLKKSAYKRRDKLAEQSETYKPRHYKAVFATDHTGKYYGNALTYNTPHEAIAYAVDLFMRWTQPTDWQVWDAQNNVITDRLNYAAWLKAHPLTDSIGVK